SQTRRDAVEHSSTSPDSQTRRDAVEHSSTSPDSQARRDAVEHGPDDVTVRVGSLADGFFVEDDGPGVPVAERDVVFEAGHSTREDGTGFGLAIVAEIADAHGWDVELTEGADGGARFEFTGARVW
ncbi:MAG: sensor histidine kinase, partial [Haloarculaceae archaeon]